MPVLHKPQVLSLEVMTLTVNTARVYTKAGVALSVDGVAQVKVGRAEEAIRTAAQQFLGKRTQEVESIALQTLEGHQRAILGTMTVEEIYQDRNAFAEQVREVASPDMANMGMEIVSFTIRDIQDEQGYLEALGVGRTAEVKRDASIGQAEADRDASIRQAILMLLSTAPGERVMRPDYGCELYRLIFSPNDDTTAGLAAHYVRRALEYWEPRIQLLKVDAEGDPEYPERLRVYVSYRLRATGRLDDLVHTIDLAKGAD